jgi:transcriptional regulator with XRE-family HTH domain
MLLSEKIKQLRKERRLTQKQLYDRIKLQFGDRAISRRTLERIETNFNDGRASSLYQICFGLGIKPRDLQEDVEAREITGWIRWDTSQGTFTYNEKAQAQVISDKDMDYLALKLRLEPGGETRPEQDPQEKTKYTKFIYVLRGELTVFVENQKYMLKQHQCASFNSARLHHYQNAGSQEAVCLLIQSPRHI